MGYGMQETDSIVEANQIQGLSTDAAGDLAMSFGDIRVAQRAEWMIERIAALGPLCFATLARRAPGKWQHMASCRLRMSRLRRLSRRQLLAPRDSVSVVVCWRCRTRVRSTLAAVTRN